MEDEDEFGDLYTDVLSTFPSSSASSVQLPSAVPLAIDLNLNSVGDGANFTDSKEGADDLLIQSNSNTNPNTCTRQEDSISGPRVLQNNEQSRVVWEEEEEVSDSDSDDDLQIVLNDSHHGHGPRLGAGMMLGSDDEDEPLVIVADHDAPSPAPGVAEDHAHDWGGEELKDSTVASKPIAALSTPPPPKIPYNPFHSHFKYVRPGAAPLPGGPPATSGGAPAQIHPALNILTFPVRGRGDWRPPGMKGPPSQKCFHPGFWGSNASGRGLDFTLPSHKTIFDVDIDSFEEKLWKYPGVDLSDFFNFGLNEESWKEYCKQLEHMRLESTMQSQIRVYESGRAEQEYDPDMPPELALAAGIHDTSAEILDTAKFDVGLGDMTKGSARSRPALPTGRSIQVETGCGERLPSVDTRPPRIRDSDAVIEIVLQESFDDESAGNEAEGFPNNESDREDDHVNVVDEDGPRCGNEYFGGYPGGFSVLPEDGSRDRSAMNNSHAEIDEEEGDRPSPQRAPSDQHPGSTGRFFSENAGSPFEERWIKAKARSPYVSSGDSALDKRSIDCQREDSVGIMEGKRSPDLYSAVPSECAQEETFERETDAEDIQAEIESQKGEEDVNVVVSSNTSEDKHSLHSVKNKLSSEVEPPLDKEDDDGGDFKDSRSSDNSKVTGSSRDSQKWCEGVDEEVVQNGRSAYLGDLKRNHGESGHDLRRKDCDMRKEMDSNYVLPKGREEYFSHRDWDLHATNHFNAKSENSDRRKEYAEISWPRRDEDPHGRRIRAEDSRKQVHTDDLVSRRRGKVREVDRSDRDEYLHSRKVADKCGWRAYHDKDVGLHFREKDDVLKSRHENIDDHHSKRKKDDEHARKDHFKKEEIFLSHRDSNNTCRKRERDVLSCQRKREDQPRMRDNMGDHHSIRLKDETWVQRERAEQQREREWYQPKQIYEEVLSTRQREDGRSRIKSSRNVEDKTLIGHSRGVEEYKGHGKDTVRYSEQFKRRERVEEANWQHRGGEDVYVRINQFAYEDKRSRQERSSSRNNHATDASECKRLHENKQKENIKKGRESEGHSTFRQSKRHQGDKSISKEMGDVKGISEQSMSQYDTTYTRELKVDASSDDELHDSKRGRSKLERWTSHKERDYVVYSKSSSLKTKELNKDKNAGSVSSSGDHDESAKKTEAGGSDEILAGGKEYGGSEGRDVDERTIDGRHLDTVEKLKRRSERFKLPLTSEKDPVTIKMESETLTSSQNNDTVNAEIKLERPPRKRRWISS